jgi:hypothetical protein
MQRTPLASLAILFALSPLACSSADFTTAGDDSGTSGDGSSTDSGVGGGDTSTNDTTPGCILPPAATGTETDFCNAVADVYSRCGNCEPCRQNNANNCIQFGDGISAAYKKAFVACKDSLTCGDFAAWAGDPCIKAQLEGATWSAKQLEAKDKFCATCTAQKFECDHFFDLAGVGGDAGPDGGTFDLGGFVALANDTSVQNMIDHCIAAGIDCTAIGFALCTASAFCDPMPHDACGSKFCNK